MSNPIPTAETIAILTQLRVESAAAWDGACETAGFLDEQAAADDRPRAERLAEERAADCRDSTARALECWDRGLLAARRASSTGDVEYVRVALECIETARQLARPWGDDRHEREALAQLREIS